MVSTYIESGTVIETDESLDLDVGYVTKLNRVADVRLQSYLTKLTGKYEMTIGKLDREMAETRREICRYKLAENRFPMKRMKMLNTGFQQNTNERRVNPITTEDLDLTENQTVARTSEPFQNVKTCATQLDPSSSGSGQGSELIYEKTHQHTLRPHTVGVHVISVPSNRHLLESRKSLRSQQTRTKDLPLSMRSSTMLRGPNGTMFTKPKFLSRNSSNNILTQRRVDHLTLGEPDEEERVKNDPQKLWTKNSCLARGHLPARKFTLNRTSYHSRRNLQTTGERTEFYTPESHDNCRPMGTSYSSLSRIPGINRFTRAKVFVCSAPVIHLA